MSRTGPLSGLLLACWAGGVWTICGVVVPGIFWLLADRQQAGNVAAWFFYVVTWGGILLGCLYWMLQRDQLDRLNRHCVLLAMGAPLFFFVVLRPWMNAARSAGDMTRFGQLHGVASVFFMATCVALGVLVWRLEPTRRAE